MPRNRCLVFCGFRTSFPLARHTPCCICDTHSVGTLGLGLVERAAVAVRRGDLVGFEKHTGVCLVKHVDVTGADSTNCVTMVASIDREESWFARSAGAPRVLVC